VTDIVAGRGPGARLRFTRTLCAPVPAEGGQQHRRAASTPRTAIPQGASGSARRATSATARHVTWRA